MSFFLFFIFAIWPIFFPGCGHNHKRKAARSAYRLAQVELAENGQTEHALKRALYHVNEAIRLEQRAEFYALQGTIFFLLQLYDQSDAAFVIAHNLAQRLVQQNARNTKLTSEIKNNRACLYAERGFFDKAEKLWQELTLDPNYLTPEVAWFNLGKRSLAEQNLAKAEGYFSRAVAAHPEYADAYYARALVKKYLGDEAGAQKDFEKASEFRA